MPNLKCVVGGCGNEPGGGISVYKFPKDRKQELNWARFVKRTRANFVVIKNCGICSEHFSEDCFDQAYKLKQQFGLLSEKNLRMGPPLLHNAVPTIISKSARSSADSSSTFFLSPEAQQLGPSGKKRRLASEKRAKKKFINELLGEPVTKPQPAKKIVQVQKKTLQENKPSEDNLPTEESPTVSWMSTICEIVLPVPDENADDHCVTAQPVTLPHSSSIPLRPSLDSSPAFVPSLGNSPALVPSLDNSPAFVPSLDNSPALVPSLDNSSALGPSLDNSSALGPSLDNSSALGPSLDNSSGCQTDPIHIPTLLPPIPKYLEASSVTKKDACTQYEDEEIFIVGESVVARDGNTSESGNSIIGEPELVSLDHGYATSTGKNCSGFNSSKPHPLDTGGSEGDHGGSEGDRGGSEGDHGGGSTQSHEGSNNFSFQTTPQKIVNERKFIVTESALDELVSALRCPKCSSPPKVVNKSDPVGTLLKVSAWCLNGHLILDWRSQPVVGEMPLLDILCCAALLLAANTFNQICNFMGFLNVNFVGKKLFNSLQNKHLCSVINSMWTNEKNSHYESLQNDSQVVLCGDSSRDVPGFCTYTLLDEKTGKVVSFDSKQVGDKKWSMNSLEKLGFTECLDQVLKKGIRVKAVATDQNAGIEEVLRERYKQHYVKHDFHMHHLSKQLSKKVRERAKLTDNGELAFLAPNMQNHLHWAAATCGGDPKVLQEKWTSVIDLVPQVKLQENEGKVLACAPVFPEGDNVWVRISSESCEELRSIVYDPQFLYDVGLLKEFYHSDGIDKYQSVMLKYCPKREKLTYQGLLARIKLAALEHNANTESTQQKKRKTKGKLKIDSNGEVIIFSKEKRKWMENSLFGGRCYAHVYDMLVEVVRRTLHQPLPPELFSSVTDGQDRSREGGKMGKLPSKDSTIHKQLEGHDRPPPPPPPPPLPPLLGQ